MLTDHLNTPRVIVNGNNQLRWTWYAEQAEAFGANRPNENPNNLINGVSTQLGIFQYHLRFPGQLFDPATGLSYNYTRDYNPRTGRYLESDLIGLAGGINTYGYVGGNPVWWVDPEGEKGSLNVIDFYQYGKCASLLLEVEKAQKSCTKECPADADLRKMIEFIDKYSSDGALDSASLACVCKNLGEELCIKATKCTLLPAGLITKPLKKVTQ